MHDLESEWPAHNQGKTLGWKAREKTQYKNNTITCYSCQVNNKQNNMSTNINNTSIEII